MKHSQFLPISPRFHWLYVGLILGQFALGIAAQLIVFHDQITPSPLASLMTFVVPMLVGVLAWRVTRRSGLVALVYAATVAFGGYLSQSIIESIWSIGNMPSATSVITVQQWASIAISAVALVGVVALDYRYEVLFGVRRWRIVALGMLIAGVILTDIGQGLFSFVVEADSTGVGTIFLNILAPIAIMGALLGAAAIMLRRLPAAARFDRFVRMGVVLFSSVMVMGSVMAFIYQFGTQRLDIPDWVWAVLAVAILLALYICALVLIRPKSRPRTQKQRA